MAAGRPVVAFDVDGVSETVLEGETGRLVPAGDEDALAEAIRGLLEAPEAAERMGAAGRRRVETTFTEAAAADGVRRVLESIGASRRGGRRGGDAVEAARP
jgi:glycosyltransferase involved in cell wall biosynthesis